MRVVLAVAAAFMAAGCGASVTAPPATSGGTAVLTALCPQVHQAVDAMVVSRPQAQTAFVVELQRLSDAGTAESRAAIAPLLEAGKALERAGTGPGYGDALAGFHPAVVRVDDACLTAGSPILHDGH